MAIKPKKHAESKEVIYSSAHWVLLSELREKAMHIMRSLKIFCLHALVHGSVARGDVNAKSDVDLFIPELPSSFLVETALERASVPINRRLLVQATPNYAIKAHIEVDSKLSVSFPLIHMRRVEREFYTFGGEASLQQLKAGIRSSGIDKRLILIEPTEKGHVESSIIGREESVAKRVGVAAETVLDRVHALLKRNEVGRTGVFLKKELTSEETFELALKRLVDENPAVRRRMR